MIDVVFISDLHLNPATEAITERFRRFIEWALLNTKTVYILGDLFHAWPGDDGLDEFGQHIADQLSSLSLKGIKVYYMHGNRDFLLGKSFAKLASMTVLSDPTVITLDGKPVLLSHGDRYCTKDIGHQWLRRLTRNRLFSAFFMLIPFSFRLKIVNKLRSYSQSNRMKPKENMDVHPESLLKDMKKHQVTLLIHGHTHKPGLTTHKISGKAFQQYVLSDWDDNPLLMCYDSSSGLHFDLMKG